MNETINKLLTVLTYICIPIGLIVGLIMILSFSLIGISMGVIIILFALSLYQLQQLNDKTLDLISLSSRKDS